jgi:Cu/Ag efflux pump CusA
VVSRIIEDGRSVDLVVRLIPEARVDPASVASTLVDTPVGGRVPLTSLAQVRVDRGPNAISREAVQRKIVVQANVAGRDLGSTVDGVRQAIGAAVSLPPGYRIEYGGQFEAQEQASRALFALSTLALGIVFLILLGEFGSARTAVLVLANLPLALICGIVAVLVTDRTVSIASLVGFVTLFGIATRNGILLVAHYRQLLGEGVPFSEALFRGSMERLSPILMTALTAGLALVPLAMAGGEPGSEIQTPMAIVILGGLLSATALNMIVVPALYWLWGDREVSGSAAVVSS